MSTFNIAALTAAFVGGASVFQKEVLDWDIRSFGVQVRTNVNTPQALTKFEVDGEPRPYRTQDDFNGATFTDRVLTAYQSKYDQQLDPEDLRNTYLADLPEMPYEDYAVQQAVKQYLDKLMTDTLWLGVRDGSGDAAADICDGFGTIIAAAISGGDLTPITTGVISNSNAVAKAQLVVAGLPVWAKKKGGRVLVSYDVFDMYAQNYASTFGMQFLPDATGRYRINNTKFYIQATDFIPASSQRITATMDNNLVFGTNNESVSMYPTPYLNILKNRILFPAGCQIRDLSAMAVNEQA